MISNAEKRLIHIYKEYAGIQDPVYREILRAKSGCVSSADKLFNHGDCDAVLAAIETILWTRVHRREIPDPRRSGHRWIREEFHFRKKAPGVGLINSRQAHKIEELWTRLQEYLPDFDQTPGYLAGIIGKATGRADIGQTALTSKDAGYVIDALVDRLAYAVRQPAEEELEAVPF